ncbi:MAG: DUF2237 family protein, partial [bacterium]
MSPERNVLGSELQPCSQDPVTGFERDGFCKHIKQDRGRHQVCAVMTEEFLEFSKQRGNDITTPRPKMQFPGLEPGDQWCVCVARWVEAYEHDCAPPVILESTTKAVLDTIELST